MDWVRPAITTPRASIMFPFPDYPAWPAPGHASPVLANFVHPDRCVSRPTRRVPEIGHGWAKWPRQPAAGSAAARRLSAPRRRLGRSAWRCGHGAVRAAPFLPQAVRPSSREQSACLAIRCSGCRPAGGPSCRARRAPVRAPLHRPPVVAPPVLHRPRVCSGQRSSARRPGAAPAKRRCRARPGRVRPARRPPARPSSPPARPSSPRARPGTRRRAGGDLWGMCAGPLGDVRGTIGGVGSGRLGHPRAGRKDRPAVGEIARA